MHLCVCLLYHWKDTELVKMKNPESPQSPQTLQRPASTQSTQTLQRPASPQTPAVLTTKATLTSSASQIPDSQLVHNK
eukprot:Pgem_evm1s9515